MPHSTTRRPSTDSQRTFDLSVVDDDDGVAPMASNSRASSSYGVALTSTPSNDERKELPSQSQSEKQRNRRKSAPGTHTYARVIESAGGNVSELLMQQRPGDRNSMRSYSYNDSSKRRSQYYEDQFQYKDNAIGQTREKVQRQSPVIAELKTNVIIKDEFTLVTDLTHHLAQRYTRPQDCIMIRVDHSACLAFGGNFEPCYFLTVNAVASQMGQSTNKRNASLIQSFLNDILSVPPERGIVSFTPIPEENLAHNGNTMLGEVEKQEKHMSSSEVNGVRNSFKDAARKSMQFNKKSTPALNGNMNSNGNLTAESSSTQSVTPPPPQAGAYQIHELPGTASNRNSRPSTAHGPFAAENGLRMNGISTEQLVGKDSRTPNGRPKTFGAPEPASMQESILNKEPIKPLPPILKKDSPTQTPASSQQRPAKPEQKRSSSTQPTKSTIVNHVPLAPRPVQNIPKASAISKTASKYSETRAKNTYLDNVSSLTKKGTEPTIVVTKDGEDDDDVPLSKLANTSKRRSTITATPKMPPPKPPPVPEDETKSVSSKLSKRKSFLRMFKRNSTPAWYDS